MGPRVLLGLAGVALGSKVTRLALRASDGRRYVGLWAHVGIGHLADSVWLLGILAGEGAMWHSGGWRIGTRCVLGASAHRVTWRPGAVCLALSASRRSAAVCRVSGYDVGAGQLSSGQLVRRALPALDSTRGLRWYRGVVLMGAGPACLLGAVWALLVRLGPGTLLVLSAVSVLQAQVLGQECGGVVRFGLELLWAGFGAFVDLAHWWHRVRGRALGIPAFESLAYWASGPSLRRVHGRRRGRRSARESSSFGAWPSCRSSAGWAQVVWGHAQCIGQLCVSLRS